VDGGSTAVNITTTTTTTTEFDIIMIMASRINIYSQLVMSLIRISDITNLN